MSRNLITNSEYHLFIIVLFCLCFGINILIEHGDLQIGAIETNSTSVPATPIKHIIVVSQGKRSFDNYFGTYPGVNGLPVNISVPMNPFHQPINKFTISVWFNTNVTLSKDGYLVNKGGVGSDTPGKNLNYGIWMKKKGNIMAGFETRSGDDYFIGSNSTYNDGKWHNAVVTYDGNNVLQLYLDGLLAASNITGGAKPDVSGTQSTRIGSNSYELDKFFIGSLAEIRIWDRALGFAEILEGYLNNKLDSSGQMAYLSFKDGNSNLTDSENRSETNPFNGMYFNGSSYRDIESGSLLDTSFLKPYVLKQTKTKSPAESSKAYMLSYNKGKMNGFLLAQVLNGGDPNLVMGHYDGTKLDFYWRLASEYVLADNFFAPTMQSGLANHQYLYTGGFVDYQKNASFRGLLDVNRTIFDELQHHRIPWKNYVQDYDPSLNYTNDVVKRNRYINLLPAIPRFVDNKTLNSNIVDLVEYFRDLRGDHFPAVSYILAPDSDDSSPNDLAVGQQFVSSLVLALMKSKYWNDTAFIITYRESGGWYDHVAPPIRVGLEYGFRVPTLIISPYAKEGYVDSTLYDITSILKFIEYDYGLSPISVRDASANNMLNAFNFTQIPRKPLLINSASLQNSISQVQSISKISDTSIITVNLLYRSVLTIMLIMGVTIWAISYMRKNKVDFIKRKKI